MVDVIIQNNRIFVTTPYELKDQIKAVPGRKWHKDIKKWSVPYDRDTCEILEQWFGLNVKPPVIKTATDKNPATDIIIDKLYTHQRQSVNIARQTDCFADLSEPGTGKTLVQIELMLERNAWPVLIICPKSIMEAVWVEQLREYNLTGTMLEGGSIKVKQILKMAGLWDVIYQIGIINYEMVPLVIKELLKINWQYIILDESTKIKSPSAKRSKAIMKLRDACKYRSIMTGTPAPNGLQDAFNQFKFIQPKIFGESFYAFRQRYFTQGGYMNYEWFAKPDAMEQFKNKIKGISSQHHKRDCIDLPPLVEEKRYVEMGADQKKYYDMMKEECLILLKELTITAPFVVTKLMKLRQIASGFIYMEDETYKVAKNNPKDKELLNILEQIGNSKVIIFAHFNETLRHIADYLDANKFKYAWFHGSDIYKHAALDSFKNEQQILLANPASAAHGLNLQHCSNIIYYELDWNLENFLQGMQRIERIGQKNKMTVYYLIVKNTLENYILKKLKDKADINKKLDINELREAL